MRGQLLRTAYSQQRANSMNEYTLKAHMTMSAATPGSSVPSFKHHAMLNSPAPTMLLICSHSIGKQASYGMEARGNYTASGRAMGTRESVHVRTDVTVAAVRRAHPVPQPLRTHHHALNPTHQVGDAAPDPSLCHVLLIVTHQRHGACAATLHGRSTAASTGGGIAGAGRAAERVVEARHGNGSATRPVATPTKAAWLCRPFRRFLVRDPIVGGPPGGSHCDLAFWRRSLAPAVAASMPKKKRRTGKRSHAGGSVGTGAGVGAGAGAGSHTAGLETTEHRVSAPPCFPPSTSGAYVAEPFPARTAAAC